MENMKTRLDLRLHQKLIMTPQLQQAIRLLQLSRLELNQVLSLEMMENPLLEDTLAESVEEEGASSGETEKEEESEPTEKTESVEAAMNPEELSFGWDEYFDQERDDGRDMGYALASQSDLPSYEQTLSKPASLVEHLFWQLRLSSLSADDQKIATAIIGDIDEDGYFRSSVEEVAKATGHSATEVLRVLRLVQEFDPSGVGARDLKECLLIQINQLGLQGSLIEGMVSHLEDLEKRRYPVIAKALGVSVEEVVQASRVLEHLEPKPGRPFSILENLYIIPDVFLVKSDGQYIVLLNDDGLPRLHINPFYRKMLRSKNGVSEATRSYLENKFRSALWLIKSIEQRNRTICRVAESIVKFQFNFFEKGLPYLKPLVLKQVAEDIEMHESTISRVTTNKYMYSPQGIYELKFFFNNSVARTGGNGDDLSSVSVREMIRKLVSEEDPRKPFKDQEIVEMLKNQKVEIARRTVAKYRAELNIQPASRRRRFG
jgi:RNA polymerase sigma-54 factor